MSYVRSSELNNDYQTPDGESLPAYTFTGPTLSPEALSLANAAVLAAHEEHNNPAGPTAAETIESLFESIHSTSDAAVAHLLSNFPNHINPNSRNHNGKTALAAAVETGNIRMVEMLINMGADVDAWSVQGEYDLHKYYYNKPWFGKLRAGGRSRPNPRRRGNPGQGGDEYPYTLQPAYQILRTPLMIASERGYLPIVKLLFNPPCNADHKLCAPDGQIALRLAVERNHREIVDFLPSVRKGGFRRFKHQHATSTYRIKQTTEVARIIAKAILYEVPKALLYRLPKWTAKKLWKLALHVITVAIPATAKAIWGGMVKCGQYVKNDLPKAVANQGKAAGKGLKKLFTVHIPNAIKSVARFFWNLFTKVIPDAITCTAKFIWRLFTHHIPHAIKKTAIFIWDLITDYLPRAIVSVGKGVWKTIKFIAWVIMKIVTSWFPAFCESVVEQLEEFATDSWDLFLRGVMAIVSLLHTIFEALASFFRRISLRDIWNGFVQVLRWVFLEVPTGIGKVLLKVYKAFVKGMETVFGWWGKAIVFLWECVVYMIVYFPVKLGGAMVEYGKVLVRGAKEVLVWFDPKK